MNSPANAALLLLCGLAFASGGGCDKAPQTPAQAMDELAARLAPRLRDGWQVGRVRDMAFAVLGEQLDVGDLHPYREAPAGDDLIVWRATPVALQPRPDGSTPTPNPGHVYFVLSRKPLIPPAEHAARRTRNEDALRQRRWVVRDVANVSRDAEGNLRPRGAAEAEQVRAFRRKYDALPAYDAFVPQYQCPPAAIRLRDYRTVLVPVAKDHGQEMNQTYVEIVQALGV